MDGQSQFHFVSFGWDTVWALLGTCLKALRISHDKKSPNSPQTSCLLEHAQTHENLALFSCSSNLQTQQDILSGWRGGAFPSHGRRAMVYFTVMQIFHPILFPVPHYSSIITLLDISWTHALENMFLLQSKRRMMRGYVIWLCPDFTDTMNYLPFKTITKPRWVSHL